jgi:hypothetical protein
MKWHCWKKLDYMACRSIFVGTTHSKTRRLVTLGQSLLVVIFLGKILYVLVGRYVGIESLIYCTLLVELTEATFVAVRRGDLFECLLRTYPCSGD